MGTVSDNFNSAFADLDGSGNPKNPAKSDLRGLGGAIESFVGSKVDPEATSRTNADNALGVRIDGEITNRQNADSSEAQARQQADAALGGRVDSEATSRTNADGALGGRIDSEASRAAQAETGLGQAVSNENSRAKQAESGLSIRIDAKASQDDLDTLSGAVDMRSTPLYAMDRPGDAPLNFTSSTETMDPLQFPGLDPAGHVSSSEGFSYRLTTQGFAVSKQYYAVEPGRNYGARVAFHRSKDPADPDGDTIRFGLLCYTASRELLGNIAIHDFSDVTVASGRQAAQYIVSRSTGTNVILLDTGVRYVRLYVQTFGGAQQTDIEVMRWIDATDSVVYTPDVQGLVDRVTAAESSLSGEIVSRQALLAAFNIIFNAAKTGFRLVDQSGFLLIRADASGFEASGLRIVPANGNVVKLIDESGFVIASFRPEGANVSGLRIARNGKTAVRFVDEAGLVVAEIGADLSRIAGLALRSTGRPGVHTVDDLGFITRSEGVRFTPDDIARANARVLALSALTRTRINTDTAAFVWDLSQIIGLGQSFMAAQEGWPVQTTSGDADVVMIGQSERGTNTFGADFTPTGDSTLRTLVATAQANAGGAVLSPSAQAALSPGDGSLGESPLVSAAILARRILRQRCPKEAFRILATNVAVPGQTIESLRSNAYFPRIAAAAQAGKTAATANGWTHGVSAFVFDQGQYNYDASHGGTTAKAAYKAAVLDYYNAACAAVMGVTGQVDPPSMIIVQTGGIYTVDANNLSIGMAQSELARDNPRIVLAGPSYQVTDKGYHNDPNGYRWEGLMVGRALAEDVIMRRRWRPLEIVDWTVRGRQSLITFNVPEPPLQFKPVLEVNDFVNHAAKGFSLTDGAGAKVAIYTAEIVADAVVLLTHDIPAGQPVGWYGRLDDAAGGGNLCDSDPIVSPYLYAYTAGSGQYASANISSMVGLPYPLQNWCCARRIACNQG